MLNTFKVHTATVETYTGATPTGDGYAAPVTVQGFYDDGLVRVQSAQGEQLMQKSRFFTDVAQLPKFTPESRFTINGRSSQVTVVHRREAGTMWALVEHIEVELT